MPLSNPSESLSHACSLASWYLRGEGYEEQKALTDEIGVYLNDAYNALIKETAQERLRMLDH